MPEIIDIIHQSNHDLLPEEKAQVNAIMTRVGPQLPTVAANTSVVADELIKNVQDILVKNTDLIISSALVTGGLAMLIPALTIGVLNTVGFTVSGVVGGSLAAAIQSSVYGGLTTGVFSVLQSIGATAGMATPAILAAAGVVAAIAGGGYHVYKEIEKNREFIHNTTEQIARHIASSMLTKEQTDWAAGEAHNHLLAAAEGAGAFFGDVGQHAAVVTHSAGEFFGGLGHSWGMW